MPSYRDPDIKGELALQAVIRAAITTIPAAQVFTTFSDDSETVSDAYVHISCQGGPEDGQNSGDERLSFRVMVSTNADLLNNELPGGPRLRHRAACREVWDCLRQLNLADQLTTAIEDFTALPGIEFFRGPNRIQERKFVSEMTLVFTALPNDLAE